MTDLFLRPWSQVSKFRTERSTHYQEMSSSSLTTSLLLLSVAFWQFVTAPDQPSIEVKAVPGQNPILPCYNPDFGAFVAVKWSRRDLESKFVLLYRNDKIESGKQHQSYKDRADLLISQMKARDPSLILKNAMTNDSGTYECQVFKENDEDKVILTVKLVVAPLPDPFPVWATVLLVLVLVAAAGVSFYFWLCWKPVPEQVEVEPGVEFVLLPFKVPRRRWFCKYRRFVDKVEWKDGDNRKVLVYQNGSYQPEEQDQIYRTRTKMDENLLKTGDLSLTLSWPTGGDSDIYTCSVYNKKGNVLMEKRVWLKVKVQQVEVESGEKFLLPFKLAFKLPIDFKFNLEFNSNGYKISVYQNYGSDQLQDQNKVNENLLKTGDLSLTLERLKGYQDLYTCSVYNRKKVSLIKKLIQLEIKHEPGTDVTSTTNKKPVTVEKMIKTDKTVATLYMDEQFPFFKKQESLKDMGSVYVSFILKSTTTNTTGRYKCQVFKGQKNKSYLVTNIALDIDIDPGNGSGIQDDEGSKPSTGTLIDVEDYSVIVLVLFVGFVEVDCNSMS